MAAQIFTWTHKTRLAVHQLDTETELTAHQKTQVFSILFPEKFIHDGKMGNRIKSQTGEWKKPANERSRSWTAVLTSSDEGERQDMRLSIRKAVAEAAFSPSGCLDMSNITNDLPRPGPSSKMPASKKRQAASLPNESMDGYDSADEPSSEALRPSPKRRMTARPIGHDQPQVQIPRAAHAMVSRPTPYTTPKAASMRARADTSIRRPARTPVETYAFRQTHGTTLYLPVERIQLASQPLVPVPEDAAHPPTSGLFFRYSLEEEDEPPHSEFLTLARRFRGKVKIHQDPPACQNLPWQDIFYHIDPCGKIVGGKDVDGKDIGYDSAFISMTNAFWWALRHALKEQCKHGRRSARISVINASALNRLSVFYAAPYHRELKKLSQFTGGGWRYPALHEFLCFKEIPRRAVVKTIKVDELFAKIERGPDISRVLRLNTLVMRLDFKKKVLSKLRDANIELGPETIGIIAKVARLMGLDSAAQPEHLSHILCDVIQGWGLRLVHAAHGEWEQLAARFARSISDRDDRIVPARELQVLESAFLDGVRYGSSKEFNTRHCPNRIRAMEVQALALGIPTPAELHAEACSRAARLTIRSFAYQPTINGISRVDNEILEEIQVTHPTRQEMKPTMRKARFIVDAFEESIAYESD
ncbi:unnamed protein product [Zymoseptoria tritici ST99CH_3D7]|uniref:DUF7587 domain-containing protein n=1 Tax=Zymoseptoria tritici (strain ST99CH_3D7) TaxID=1276538 RepID=A0A1X7REJ1_ZYMT9|nr:unnamed protein product [Zymoseptoria tritici ST99CH_3D7]